LRNGKQKQQKTITLAMRNPNLSYSVP